MKLETKHLAPYLPYELKYKIIGEDDRIYVIDGIYSFNDVYSDNNGECAIIMIKPILRPLKNLRKFPPNEDKSYGDKIDLIGYFDIKDFIDNPKGRKYWQVQKLFEWHFDVFGLIENGLALSYNDL